MESRRVARIGIRADVFLTIFIFCIAIMLAIAVYGTDRLSHNILTLSVLFCYAYCIWLWKKNKNSVISIFSLFILYAFLSNAGQCLLYTLYVPTDMLSIYRNFSLESIINMLRFHLVCSAGLLVGVSIGSGQRIMHYATPSEVAEHIRRSDKQSQIDRICNIIMFFAFAFILAFAVYQIQQRQYLSYADYYNMEGKQRLPERANLLAVILGVRAIAKKQHSRIVYGVWICFILLFFLAGTRSTAIVYVAVIIAMLPKSNPGIFKKQYIIPWIIVGLILFGYIGVTSAARTAVVTGFGSFGSFSGSFWDNIISTISEMGGSARPTIITMQYIDEGGQKLQTIIYTILHGVIPTDILTAIDESWATQLGSWINSYAGAIGTQYGYSFIAEAYMNYGWLGCIFMMFYGWLISAGERKANALFVQDKEIYAGIILALLGRQVFFARANLSLILSFYRNSIYLIVIIWFLKKITITRYDRNKCE